MPTQFEKITDTVFMLPQPENDNEGDKGIVEVVFDGLDVTVVFLDGPPSCVAPSTEESSALIRSGAVSDRIQAIISAAEHIAVDMEVPYVTRCVVKDRE